MSSINKDRLFYASCFALITTAFSFAIRAGILPALSKEYNLSAEQLGSISSMWFLGFPLSMIIGGLLYNKIGPKIIMQIAFFCHTLGIILTIYPDILGAYLGLMVGTFLIGVGNGCTEAACNPMIADSYTGTEMNTKMNRFHMWFPGGIVIGSLLSEFMTNMNFSWRIQYGIIVIPAIIYAILFWGQIFPKSKSVTEGNDLSKNIAAMFTPLFIAILLCMALTASSEFVPQNWSTMLLKASGAKPMIILALITGLMAVARYFGGDLVHKLDQSGVLLGGAILTTIGVYLFSISTGAMTYVAAIIFALGVAYFWPNMIGFVAEKLPKTGALGMSIVGAMGMFATSLLQPIIGSWIDKGKIVSAAKNGIQIDPSLKGESLAKAFETIPPDKIDAVNLAAGQATLGSFVWFPAILIAAFALIYLSRNNLEKFGGISKHAH